MKLASRMNYAFPRRRAVVLLSAGLLACPVVAPAASFTWNGSSSSGFGYLSEPDNWVGNAAPPTSGADLIFGSLNTHSFAPTMNVSYSVNSLTFNSSAQAFIINGGPLTINGGGITDSSTNQERLGGNTSINLGASQTWNVAAGSLWINGDALTSSSSLTKIGSGTLLLSLIGSSNVIGNLALQGGLTQISTGTLACSALPAAVTLTNSSTLNISGGAVIQAYGTGSGDLQIAGNSSVLVTGTGSLFNGSGYQTLVGNSTPGTLTVTSGGSDIAAIGLVVGYGASGGTGTLNVSAGGTVTSPLVILSEGAAAFVNVNGSGSTLTASTELDLGGYQGTSYATGTLTITNNGLVNATLTQFFNSASSINISGGTLNAGYLTGLNTAAPTITLAADPSGGYALNTNTSGNTYTYYGYFAGTGTFNKSGGYTQVLAASLTLDGKIIVSGGSLVSNGLLLVDPSGQLNAAGGSLNINAGLGGSGTIYLTNPPGGPALNISGGSSSTFFGTINGSGSLIKTGLGSQTLAGANNFTGTVGVTGGLLDMANSAASSLQVGNGTLEVDSGSSATQAAINSGGLLTGAANVSNVTINAGGTYAPGGVFSGSIPGGSAATIQPAVTGNIVSAANLNITAATTALSVPGSTSTFTINGTLNGSNTAVTRTGPGTLNLNSAGSSTLGSLSLQGGATQISTGFLTINNAPGILLQNSSLSLVNGAIVNDLSGLSFNTSDTSVTVNGSQLLTTSLKSAAAGYGAISLNNGTQNGELVISPTAPGPYNYSGSVTGAGLIEKSGLYVQILSGNNTQYTGMVLVAGGKLEMNTSTPTYVEAESGGIFQMDYGTLGSSVVSADTGGTVIYNAPVITGGTLLGNGTHNVAAVQYFIGTTIGNGAVLTPISLTTLAGINNQGTIINPAGSFLYVSGANAGGMLNISGSTNLASLTSSGILQINPGGSVSNTQSNLVLLGGSRTYIGSAAAPGGQLEMNLQTIQLNGGLLANYGTIYDGVVDVNYGGLATGTGNYSSGVVVNPGGTYMPGNYGTGSPAAVLGSPFAMIQPAASGATTAAPAITVATTTMITVNAGDTLTLAGGLHSAGQAVNKLGGGTVITAPFSATDLNISAGSVGLSPSASVLSIGTLEVSGPSTLDLSSDSADIGIGTLSSITALAKLGYANGEWNGPGGITSSTAAADPKHLTAIGVIQNNQSGTAIYTASHPFEGTTPGAGDVLAKYTYYGDANLSGKVDSADYTLIDAGFLAHGTKTGWFNGDFNYDGVINGSDYTLIDNAFNTQGETISTEIASPTALITGSADTTVVPEPTALGITLLATAGLLRRRRNARGLTVNGPIL